MNKIGFIGLGVMGYPMAGHLQSMGMMLLFSIDQQKNLINGAMNFLELSVRILQK